MLLYRRYIDDLFFIWSGSLSSLHQFLEELNCNTSNIKLTSELSENCIHFLDINIYRQGNKLGTSVYFKPTDSNIYLPIQSGHYPMWLRNIPKGQLTRVRRNCTKIEDFESQALIMKKKFVENLGYHEENLDRIIENIALIPREEFLRDGIHPPKSNYQEWSFICGFHAQHKEVEEIFVTHWHILLMDKVLKPALPLKPGFIYRRAPSYADKIVNKIIDPPCRHPSFLDKDGFYACRKCRACKEVRTPIRALEKFVSTSNNKEFRIKEFITCNTAYVVYALQCPCGFIYIGRTKRLLKIRIAEHIANIKIGFKDHNVSLHFKIHQNQDPSGLKFWGIDHLKPFWRGSNLVRELSKRETQWILLVDTLLPKGLNVDLDINCFISDY